MRMVERADVVLRMLDRAPAVSGMQMRATARDAAGNEGAVWTLNEALKCALATGMGAFQPTKLLLDVSNEIRV